MLVEAEGEGLEPPQACARRFSRPLQYHYANPPKRAIKYKSKHRSIQNQL